MRLLSFGASSLDVEVFAYFVARDWNHFLELQEGALLQILAIVESAGARLAIPAQITYFAAPPGSDAPGLSRFVQVQQLPGSNQRRGAA